MGRVRIDGLGELRRTLGRVTALIRADAAAGVRDAAEEMADDARTRAAVDTGTGRAGIDTRYSDGGLSADVGIFDPDLDYMQYPEDGTSSQPAQPALGPAAERARTEAPRRIAERIARRWR